MLECLFQHLASTSEVVLTPVDKAQVGKRWHIRGGKAEDVLKVVDSLVVMPPEHAAGARQKPQIWLAWMLPERGKHQLLSGVGITATDSLLSNLAEPHNGRWLHHVILFRH